MLRSATDPARLLLQYALRPLAGGGRSLLPAAVTRGFSSAARGVTLGTAERSSASLRVRSATLAPRSVHTPLQRTIH